MLGGTALTVRCVELASLPSPSSIIHGFLGMDASVSIWALAGPALGRAGGRASGWPGGGHSHVVSWLCAGEGQTYWVPSSPGWWLNMP